MTEYLQHIRDEASYLERATAGLSAEEFVADETLKRACVRAIEVIGEATKKSPRSSGSVTRRWIGARWPGCATA